MSIWNLIWPIPAPPNPITIGENQIKNEIEEDLKNDLNTDALKIINGLASNRLGQDVLNYINTLKQGNDLKDLEWAVDEIFLKTNVLENHMNYIFKFVDTRLKNCTLKCSIYTTKSQVGKRKSGEY